jgi:hypothetical protein
MAKMNIFTVCSFLPILLLISCKTPEPAFVEYRHEIIEPVLLLQKDLNGEAPKNVIKCVYQFYMTYHRWPNDISEFNAFTSKECELVSLTDFQDLRFNTKTDGSCAFTMVRKGYTMGIVLPKP